MKLILPEEKKVILLPLVLFFLIILLEIIAILIFNSGLFVYTTDDSYIHLALSENILKGHYGVNIQENSSPSSSILWPFLLAPFTVFNAGYLVPLIVNIISSVGTILVFFLILKDAFYRNKIFDEYVVKNFSLLILILLIIGTNLTGVIFIGMEHSLQIFLSVLIIWGLIHFVLYEKIPRWLFIVLVIAPLIRYENLALSFSSLAFLFLNGMKKKSLFSFITIVILVSGFSFFLLSIGLKPLPFSVLQKSSVVSDTGVFSVLINFKENILNPRGFVLFIGVIFLVLSSLSNKRNRKERLLAGCFALAVLAHLVIGKDGRYIVYIWASSIMIFIFLYREPLNRLINKKGFVKTAIIFSAATILFSYYYLLSIIMIPLASNNIYEQQYQMHRFVVDYYKKPVAVNDLGYISYKNDNYVLDLVGLASEEALHYQQTRSTSEWIDTLSKKYNVELAMIYDDWFTAIPGSWFKAAELLLGKMKMGASRDRVSFYLINKKNKDEFFSLLIKFKKTLPDDVKMIIYSN